MLAKIIGIIVAIVVIAVVAAGAGMYFRLIPIPGPLLALLAGAKEPEYSARYYPADTLAYAWVTLAPGGGQLADMQDIFQRFNEYRDFRRIVDELQDDFEDETGIDFEGEVQPWVGPDAAVGFIDYDTRRDDAIIVAVISVRDNAAAGSFLRAWLDYMEDEEGADFDPDSYKDFEIWADDSNHQVYGLSKDLLVFATTESGFREVADAVAGDTDRSLADNENFKSARAALSERRFASVYVDYKKTLDLVEDLAIDEIGFTEIGGFDEHEPEWIAASAAWFDRAVAVETVMPIGIDQPLEIASLDDPASLVSDDTLAFIAGTFDPNLDNWRVALRSYDLADFLPESDVLDEINSGVAEISGGSPPELSVRDSLSDMLDLVLWLVDDLTGINLEDALFDHLGGEAILAIGDVDFADVDEDPLSHAIDGVVMLSYRDGSKENLADTMNEVTGLIEDQLFLFIETDAVDVGADDDATLFEIRRELVQTDYSPGYVLHGGYLTIGTTEDALEATVDLQNGGGSSLASYTEYGRAAEHLPAKRQMLGYVNLHRIILQIGPDDFDMTDDEFEILEEGLSVAVISSYSPHCLNSSGSYICEIPGGTDVTRITAVLTLFPE